LMIIRIDNKKFHITGTPTVKQALEDAGYKSSVFSYEGNFQAPCMLGGCYACVVLMNKNSVRSCITRVEQDCEISTQLPPDHTPLRIIHGPEPHPVGGKATPWWLKSKTGYIEVAIWTAGCNLRCPQCQNYHVTYDKTSKPISPQQAAEIVTHARRQFKVDRMAISGGEPTLNRPWLIQFFRHLKTLNPDENARLHLDSNGTILTRDYIDELILDAEITDIGIEPKGIKVPTFMKITGILDRKLASRYLDVAWDAIEYVVSQYKNKVFLGVGLPYNKALIDQDEVREFGRRLATIDPEAQLCVLDYFPAFKRNDIQRPSPAEMLEVKKILNATGLKTVIVQTSAGHVGP
jgi:pyruvate formate lyase activating enzyme